jgi:hypothetical protein
MCVFGVLKKREYTMRVCIFRVRCTLLAGISIVYLNLGKILDEYTMRVCILRLRIKGWKWVVEREKFDIKYFKVADRDLFSFFHVSALAYLSFF